MIGSDFKPKLYRKTIRCSECGLKFPAGSMMLVSEKSGKIKKVVCSEECRLDFDNKFWQAAATKNEGRKR